MAADAAVPGSGVDRHRSEDVVPAPPCHEAHADQAGTVLGDEGAFGLGAKARSDDLGVAEGLRGVGEAELGAEGAPHQRVGLVEVPLVHRTYSHGLVHDDSLSSPARAREEC